MSRAARTEKQHHELISLEKEFRQLLIGALKECTDGGDGVFLLSEKAEERGLSRFVWPVTKELETLGERIYELRTSFRDVVRGITLWRLLEVLQYEWGKCARRSQERCCFIKRSVRCQSEVSSSY